MTSKLCPQVEALTDAVRPWVETAPAVKSIDDVAVFQVARSDALLVWRHYLANQDTTQPEATVDEVVAAMGGFRAPGRLVLEIWNECHPTADQMRRAVLHAHALGFLVAIGSWGTGDYTQSDWDAATASGADYIAVHAYWSPSGPTEWNGFRWREFWKPGHPKVLVTECGFDKVRDGANGSYVGEPGWVADGLSLDQVFTALASYAAAISADPAVAFAFPFGEGLTPDWADFLLDGIAGRLAALESPPPSPAPQPQPQPLPGGLVVTDFPDVVWEPSPNFGYPNRGVHGRKDPVTGVVHRVVALVMHIEQGSETATDYTFDSAASQVSSTVSNPRAAGAKLRQHVHDDDAAWAQGIDTTLGIAYYRSDTSLAWLMDCYRLGTNPNIILRSVEHEGISGQNLTPEQYARTLAWCVYQFRKEGWMADEVEWRIIGHFQINLRDKAGCPGPGFPMAQLRKDVAAALTAPPPPFKLGALAGYLTAHPDLGAPRMDSWSDPFGDEFVYLTATPAHPKGPLVIWRHSTNEVGVAFA